MLEYVKDFRMPQTPLGYYQRTNKGRFLYGRTANYRLAGAYTTLPNANSNLGTSAPLDGEIPLEVDNDIGEYTTLPTIADIAAVPTGGAGGTSGGIYAQNPGGGYAVTGLGYARTDDPTAIAPVNNWHTDDNGVIEEGGGSESTTPYTYTLPGTYDVSLVMSDCLARSSAPDYTGPVVTEGELPVSDTTPTLAGTTEVGDTLTITPGTYTGSEPITLSYTWWRTDGVTPVQIAGETGLTYELAVADLTFDVYAEETATNILGSAAAEATNELGPITSP